MYRMDTVMVDQEPHRSVQLIRRIDTRVPVPLLSQQVASTQSTMGRLVDVRLGSGRGAGAGAASGGSAWDTSGSGGVTGASGSVGRWNVVAKSALGGGGARSGSGTPVRVPSPAVQSREGSPGPSRSTGLGASASAGAGTGVGTSAGGTKAVWMSPTVQVQRGRETVVAGNVPVVVVEGQGAPGAGADAGGREGVKDVPDDWEDDV